VEIGKAVSALLADAGLDIGDIGRVAVVIGPGSFTGLRVGLAYVKGLIAAHRRELVTMTSLELLARQAGRGATGPIGKDVALAPMIDARRNEVYAAHYVVADQGTLAESVAPTALAPVEFLSMLPVRETIFIGSGALKFRAVVEQAFGTNALFPPEVAHAPDVALFCRLAESLIPLSSEEVAVLEPFYIRPSDIQLQPLRGVRAYDRHQA
jgi:tRNA threonylcarbamoyladenosine biosynthesis protein TsaB